MNENEQRIRELLDQGYSVATAQRHVLRGEDLPSVPDGNRPVPASLDAMRARVADLVDANVPAPDSTFREIVDGVYAEISAQTGDAARPNNIVRQLQQNPELMRDIETRLGPDRPFGFVGRGDHALAISFTDDAGNRQILRITDQISESLPNSRIVLTPSAEARVGNLRLQVNEPVASLGQFLDYNGGPLNDGEVAAIIDDTDARLWREGNYSVDGHHGNYGMTREGRIVVPDLEAVRSIESQRAAMARGEMIDLRAVESQMDRVQGMAERLPADAGDAPRVNDRVRTNLLDNFPVRTDSTPTVHQQQQALQQQYQPMQQQQQQQRQTPLDTADASPASRAQVQSIQAELRPAAGATDVTVDRYAPDGRANNLREHFNARGEFVQPQRNEYRQMTKEIEQFEIVQAERQLPREEILRRNAQFAGPTAADAAPSSRGSRLLHDIVARADTDPAAARVLDQLEARLAPVPGTARSGLGGVNGDFDRVLGTQGQRLATPDLPNLASMPDAPHVPRAGMSTPRVAGVAGAVAMAALPGVMGVADRRDDESFGHAVGRGYRNAFMDTFRPIQTIQSGDYGLAAAQVADNTGVAVSAYVQEYRTSEAARNVTPEQTQSLSASLPRGNMSLGSPNSRLNLIAKLLAYRDEGTEHLTVGSSLFSAEPQIYGPGAPGMMLAEGTRVVNTRELLDEQVRNFIAEGGTVETIREALDQDYYRQQVYLRMRNVVPDPRSPGYEHRAIEAREGMQELEEFRTLVQTGRDNTPEGRARAIELTAAYLQVNDYDENRMIRNASYQFTRMDFPIARPEDLVAAGMGPLFNITGRPENLREDLGNVMKVLSQPSGGPDGEQIFGRINPGSDRVAGPEDILAALPPEMQQQVRAEQARIAAAAPPPAAVVMASAPTPTPAPEPEPEPVVDIVVTGQRYRNAPADRAVSERQNRLVEANGLTSFLDANGDGVLQLGELRSRLRDAGVTIADSGRVSDAQLTQSLPQLQAMRDESQGRT